MRLKMIAVALVLVVTSLLPCAAGSEGSVLPGYIDVKTNDVKELLSGDLKDQIVLIDVRQPDEYEEGHIEGAALIPLDELPNRLPEIDRAKIVLVVCWSGYRSSLAAGVLVEAGFDRVYNYAGGMSSWDGPVVTGLSASQLPSD